MLAGITGMVPCAGVLALDRAWPGVDRDVGPLRSWVSLMFQLERSPRSAALAQSDDDLMQRIASGDHGAYRTFSERHLSATLRYAARLLGDPSEAEDVVQETFLRLWQQAERYEPRGSKPSTWLYRIAHNLCIDRLRRRRPGDPAALDRHSSGDRPSALLDRKQLAREVQCALASLPERQRAALCLVHYEGLTNLEAAAVLDCGVHAVESLLARARRNLRGELAGLYAQVKEELP